LRLCQEVLRAALLQGSLPSWLWFEVWKWLRKRLQLVQCGSGLQCCGRDLRCSRELRCRSELRCCSELQWWLWRCRLLRSQVLQEPLPSWLRSLVRQRLRKRLQRLQWWLCRQELCR
jgi:hypothetical protein